VSNARCLPVAPRTRPNVILIISDDQGECHYGTAGECRSAQTGPPIPPASTPNLDVLAAYGTMFPIAHNTASWCFPSLNSLPTGRYQKSFNGSHDLSGDFLTVPQVLRSLEGEAGGAIEFNDVLLGNDGNAVRTGVPALTGAKVTGEIVRHGRGDKIVVFKQKRRKNYARKRGHRQGFTEVRINDISLG